MDEFRGLTGGGAQAPLPVWVHWVIATLVVAGLVVVLAVVRPSPGAILERMRRLAATLEPVRRVAAALLRVLAPRLGLLALGLVAGLVLAELSLQTIALARRMVAPAASGGTTSTRPVLAVGDSNTYGLYLSSDEEPYPARLERLWNARHPGQAIEVVNLGYPGTNSSVLLGTLPELLARLRPSVVTILVGANDFWTEPVSLSSAGPFSRLRRWSRVYPLLVLLRQWVDPPLAGAVDPALARETGNPLVDERAMPLGIKQRDVFTRDWIPALRDNIARMVVLVREAGAEPVLLTYPGAAPWHSKTAEQIRAGAYPPSAPWYMAANDAIRGAARTIGARLIDVDAAFYKRCPSPDCGELLFPDLHPRASGHETVAEVLVAWNGWARAAP